MPYNCEECNEIGARMNDLHGIRLCKNCPSIPKYKMLCKSEVIKKYKLTQTEINNYPYEIKYSVNPHFRRAHEMILFYEKDVKNYFIALHNELITNILNIDVVDENNIDEVVNSVFEHIKNKKSKNKDNKMKKILKKYNLDLDDLDDDLINKIENTKTLTDIENIIKTFIKKEKLLKALKNEDMEEYIGLSVCTDYINYDSKNDEYDIVNKIKNMIVRKNEIKKAIEDYNLPKQEFLSMYNNYITSDKDNLHQIIETIIDRINRKKNLIDALKERGLTLRNDSTLCNQYLNGSNEYALYEVVNIMEEMDWFFSHSNYSNYMKKRSNYNYYDKYDKYDYYFDYEYDSDSSYDSNDYKQDLLNRSENAKIKCLKDWINKGKKGIPPPNSLNFKIYNIEFEMMKDEIKNIITTTQFSNDYIKLILENIKDIKYKFNHLNFNDDEINDYIKKELNKQIIICIKNKFIDIIKNNYDLKTIIYDDIKWNDIKNKVISTEILEYIKITDNEYNKIIDDVKKELSRIRKNKFFGNNKSSTHDHNKCNFNGCTNIFSNLCIDFRCKTCCNNKNCKKHF